MERGNPAKIKSVIRANCKRLFKHVIIVRGFGPSKYRNVQYHTNSNLSDSCNSCFSLLYNEKICAHFNHKNKRYNTRVKKTKALAVRGKKALHFIPTIQLSNHFLS